MTGVRRGSSVAVPRRGFRLGCAILRPVAPYIGRRVGHDKHCRIFKTPVQVLAYLGTAPTLVRGTGTSTSTGTDTSTVSIFYTGLKFGSKIHFYGRV